MSDAKRRQSAGTISPADRKMTSPGTRARISIRLNFPSRMTFAVGSEYAAIPSSTFCALAKVKTDAM